MKRLEARGSSDDTFGVYGHNIDVEHDDSARGMVRAVLVDAGNDGRILVTGVYGHTGGTWSIGLALVEEDDLWPSWARPEWGAAGYTPVMELMVPDHATVTLALVDGKRP